MALLQTLQARKKPRQLHLILGVLQAKELDASLANLGMIADCITVTEPQVYGKAPRSAAELALLLETSLGKPVRQHRVPSVAISAALEFADAADLIVVAGSLYLAGEMRAYWYPNQQVLDQGTSWPEAAEVHSTQNPG